MTEHLLYLFCQVEGKRIRKPSSKVHVKEPNPNPTDPEALDLHTDTKVKVTTEKKVRALSTTSSEAESLFKSVQVSPFI